MPYVYPTRRRKDGKQHPRWRFEYVNWKGERKKGSGTTSKEETLEMACEVQAHHDMIRKGHLPPPKEASKPRPFDEVMEAYMAYGRLHGGHRGKPWDDTHERMKRTHLKFWQEKLALKNISDLVDCLPKVEKELDALHGAGKTISHYAEAIRSFCNWCVKYKHLEGEAPLKYLGKFDTDPVTKRRAFTVEELTKLFSVAPPEYRLLYETDMCTGLRADELRHLEGKHLDTEKGTLYLDPAWTKSRKPGFQPIPAVLAQRLKAFYNSGTAKKLYKENYNRPNAKIEKIPPNPLLYVPSHTARTLDRDLKAAGIPKVTYEGKLDFHASRTTYSTLVLDAGANPKDLQELMRHSTAAMSIEIYGRARKNKLNDIVEKIGETVLGQTGTPTEPQQAEEADAAAHVTRYDKGTWDAWKQPEASASIPAASTTFPVLRQALLWLAARCPDALSPCCIREL